MKKLILALMFCVIFNINAIWCPEWNSIKTNSASLATGVIAGIVSTAMEKNLPNNNFLKAILIPTCGLLTIKYFKTNLEDVHSLDILTFILTTTALINKFSKKDPKPDNIDNDSRIAQFPQNYTISSITYNLK